MKGLIEVILSLALPAVCCFFGFALVRSQGVVALAAYPAAVIITGFPWMMAIGESTFVIPTGYIAILGVFLFILPVTWTIEDYLKVKLRG